MPIRVKWDRYEVALLIAAYERVASGADVNLEAAQLSQKLRALAIRRGITIDDTYRNVTGMKMQLGLVKYLDTDKKHGLSNPSAMLREVFEIYKTKPEVYQAILKEAIRLTSPNESVEDSFLSYAEERTTLSPAVLTDHLRKAADYCALTQPLLGMTDIVAVRNVSQKVSKSILFRFKYAGMRRRSAT